MGWISVKDRLPNTETGSFRVKTADDKELPCLYYQDAMNWITFYGQKSCRWWEANHPYDPVFNVTHWLELLKNPVKKQ